MGSNVSGIVVLSRLSGMPISSGDGKELMEKAADRLYINGMPALMFYGMGKKESLTEEDYNTLGKNIANTLKETFLDKKGKNFLMFKGEGEDSFTPFTMGAEILEKDVPKEVKLYSGIKKVLASKEDIEKNLSEYNDYVNLKVPHYEMLLKLKEISEEAISAASSLKPVVNINSDKVRKTSIEELQRENGFAAAFNKPARTMPVMQKAENSLSEEKEPQLMAPSRGARRNRPKDDN